MQYLLINKTDTLLSISKTVGQQNVGEVLAENGIDRTPRVGQAWSNKCRSIIEQTPSDVSASRKSALLNNLVGSAEVFEKACLMDEDDWKVFSSTQAFPDALRVPESVQLPDSATVIGNSLGDVKAVIGNIRSNASGRTAVNQSAITTGSADAKSEPVSPAVYRAVMNELKSSSSINPAIFETVNSASPVKLNQTNNVKHELSTESIGFPLPWGKIQMYSSLLSEIVDFPVYPEQLSTNRSASYATMPNIIYQYEPWITYESSGPREQSLSFHMHRDMWTGDHRDGQANKLIRFCEANTFPEYNGSMVLAPSVRLYIDGSLFISGVITSVTVDWSGPIGLDNWYLEFTLNLTMQEVSDMALNINSVRSLGLKGN